MKERVISIQFVDSLSEIPEQLWARCFEKDSEMQFLHRILEESHLESEYKLEYAIITCNEKEIGVVPLYLIEIPLNVAISKLRYLFKFLGVFKRSFQYKRVLMVGSPNSEEGVVGLIEGYTLEDVCVALQNALEEYSKNQSISLIVWRDFPEERNAAFNKLIDECSVFKFLGLPGTYLNLSHLNTMDDFIDGLKAHTRQTLLKKIRLSKATLESTLIWEQFLDEKTIDEVYYLYTAVYNKQDVKLDKLNKSFFFNAAKEKAAWFLLMREAHSKKLIAFTLCFKLENKVISKFCGMDYSQPKTAFLYFRMQAEIISWTIENNIDELEGSQSGYSGKRQFDFKLVPLYSYGKHKNRLINYILSLIGKKMTLTDLDGGLSLYKKNDGV